LCTTAPTSPTLGPVQLCDCDCPVAGLARRKSPADEVGRAAESVRSASARAGNTPASIGPTCSGRGIRERVLDGCQRSDASIARPTSTPSRFLLAATGFDSLLRCASSDTSLCSVECAYAPARSRRGRSSRRHRGHNAPERRRNAGVESRQKADVDSRMVIAYW
jgi:hypothetical protein